MAASVPASSAAGAAKVQPPSTIPLRFLHFNDVYNVYEKNGTDPDDNCGGAARFVALVNSYRAGGARHDPKFGDPIVLFSGDAYFPSIESQVTLGKHMCSVLRNIGADANLLANHDVDGGLERFEQLAMISGPAPWLLSNVRSKARDGALLSAVCKEFCIIERNGVRLGIVGVAEREWVETLTCIDESDILFEEPASCIKRLAPGLRKAGAQHIVALSHMRVARDYALLESDAACEFELLLGGHDHHFEHTKIGQKWLVKSGTDFRDLSVIDCAVSIGGEGEGEGEGGGGSSRRFEVEKLQRVKVVRSMSKDPATVGALAELKEQMQERMKKVIGHSEVLLDARFAVLRTRESNISNFVADAIRWNVKLPGPMGGRTLAPDAVLFNAGTLRTDAVIPRGEITVRVLLTLLPMLDALSVVQATGPELLEALENGVSQVPQHEGRFPCVSGLRFAYDATKEPGSRVVPESVFVGKNRVDLSGESTYTVCVKEYLLSGKDGYTVFTKTPVVPGGDCESLPALAQCVQRYLLCQQAAQRMSNSSAFEHHVVKAQAARWRKNASASKQARVELRKQRQQHRQGGDPDGTGSNSAGKLAVAISKAAAEAGAVTATSEDDEREANFGDAKPEEGAATSAAAAPTVVPSTPFVKKIFAIRPRVDGRITELSGMFAKTAAAAVEMESKEKK